MCWFNAKQDITLDAAFNEILNKYLETNDDVSLVQYESSTSAILESRLLLIRIYEQNNGYSFYSEYKSTSRYGVFGRHSTYAGWRYYEVTFSSSGAKRQKFPRKLRHAAGRKK